MTTQIPKLRFPEFSDLGNKSNIKHSFSDIFLFSTGKNIKQNEASPDFETPCVRYGELYYMYNEVITKVFNKTNLDKSELLLSKGDEILLPSAGEDPLDIGSASALTIENVAIGRTINILKPSKNNVYSQIYVAYYINHKLRKKISTLAKGSSISNVYNSDLKTLEIILPTLAEQTKIANFLTTIEEKIQALKEKKRLSEEYKKGLMQKIFSQEIRFKKDDGSDFDDWEQKSLGEIALKKSSSISANKIEENFGDFIIYGASGVLKRVDFYEEENDYVSIVKDGAGAGRLLFCKGKSSVLGTMEIIKPKLSVNTYFLFYLLSTFDFTKYITGSTIPHIYFKDYSLELCELPSREEQDKIAHFLTAIDEKIEKVIHLIEEAQTYKKGLLQQMFV
ncbi:restriction endonuclease subunit S [Lacihabitans sp. CCS-44]|uniref:restriction endonuclease subunit S n=1 Tax=Lacihabitans sp. CCS-44 TaxID=2487331 RepID=UPI0020CD33B6|nr:restriction endonuclease subunit S [Lacihabitans sp. CCS-44]MCP9755975.1 restriction endonuclease subunit S [Lacihabitans sp. CCS-44]